MTRRKPSRILLVEDNVDHAELIQEGLRGHAPPPRVRHLPDGESALEYLAEIAGSEADWEERRPNLILLDLRLPRMDGLRFLSAVKADERFRRIPVVVLTSSGSARDVREACRRHANSYLVKPVDFGELERMMHGLAAYWLGWNHTV